MKIARIIDHNGLTTWAIQNGIGLLVRAEGDPLAGTLQLTDQVIEAKRWLPPLDPTVLIGIGLNYAEHADESDVKRPTAPIVFTKNPSSAIGHGETIRLPAQCDDEVDFECELAVVIGRRCLNVSEQDALSYVFGYTCANDVSARIWQLDRCGGQWFRGKSFDTFAPIGPYLVTADDIPDPCNIGLRTFLNGERVQDSNTSKMIFSVPYLISFLSQDTTLMPGTVILTGTPDGVGWVREPRLMLQDGDVVDIEVDTIGKLTNNVKKSAG